MKTLLLVFLLFYSISGIAQSIASDNGIIYLYPNETNTGKASERRGSYSGEHPFGAEVTIKMNKLENEYVYFVKSTGAYPVDERIVLKKSIYNAVKKIEKFYFTKLEKAEMSSADVESEFSAILDKAVKLPSYETSSVESDLKKIKKPEELIIYFRDKIKFKENQ